MKESTRMILTELSARYPVLKGVEKDVEKSFEIMKECFVSGGTLYLCGNGGSSADCEHIAGELMKRFKKDRPLNEALVCELKKYGEEGQVLMEGLEGGSSYNSRKYRKLELDFRVGHENVKCREHRPSQSVWSKPHKKLDDRSEQHIFMHALHDSRHENGNTT